MTTKRTRDDYRRAMEAEAPRDMVCIICDVPVEDSEWGIVTMHEQGGWATRCVGPRNSSHEPTVVGPDREWVQDRMSDYDGMEALLHRLVADGVLNADEPIAVAVPRLLANVGLERMADDYGYRRWDGQWERDPRRARRTLKEATAEIEAARSRLISEVRRQHQAGVNVATIAREANVSRQTIYTWLDDPRPPA